MPDTNSPSCALSEISGSCCHCPSAEQRVCQRHPRQLAPWLGDIHPGCSIGDAVSGEGKTPGNKKLKKLVYKEEEGLNDSSPRPRGGFSQDQKVTELSGGSSSSVYAGAIEHPLRATYGGRWRAETETQTSLSHSLPELPLLIGRLEREYLLWSDSFVVRIRDNLLASETGVSRTSENQTQYRSVWVFLSSAAHTPKTFLQPFKKFYF